VSLGAFLIPASASLEKAKWPQEGKCAALSVMIGNAIECCVDPHAVQPREHQMVIECGCEVNDVPMLARPRHRSAHSCNSVWDVIEDQDASLTPSERSETMRTDNMSVMFVALTGTE
jgi:hypothetical protein